MPPDDRQNPLPALAEGAAGGVQAHRVLRRAQGGGGAVGIVVVPLLHLPENILIGLFRSPLPQLLPAAAGPVLRGGGEEDFHLGLRQDHGADVPAIHDDAPLPGQAPLHLHQKSSDLRNTGDSGGEHGDLRQADALGHVLSVEEHPLEPAVPIAQINMDLRQGGGDRCPVSGVDAPVKYIQAHRAVNSPGVHVDKAQFLGGASGDAALSRAAGSVDGYGDMLSHAPIPSRLYNI